MHVHVCIENDISFPKVLELHVLTALLILMGTRTLVNAKNAVPATSTDVITVSYLITDCL